MTAQGAIQTFLDLGFLSARNPESFLTEDDDVEILEWTAEVRTASGWTRASFLEHCPEDTLEVF